MKVTSISIFNRDGAFHFHATYSGSDSQDWPIIAYIHSSEEYLISSPSVTLFMTLPELIAFKNSVLSALDNVMKEAGYGK